MEKSLTLEVEPWLMQTIELGLVKLPWEVANPAIVEILRQKRVLTNGSNGSAKILPDASGTGEATATQ